MQTPDIEQESSEPFALGELFGALGFDIADEDSYDALAEYAELNGQQSSVHRGDITLHGRCWRLGDGLEVWSVLYESRGEIYYADCRPAFRSKYVRTVRPWELIEYDEDGEAILRGSISGTTEVFFELQNFTAVSQRVFRDGQLNVGLAGLAYEAQVHSPSRTPGSLARVFDASTDGDVEFYESDYVVEGRVLAMRDMKNSVTGSELVWFYLDASQVCLEVLVNRRSLRGRPRIGAGLRASVWLQGHVFEDSDLLACYEGVDRDYSPADFWNGLRRSN